MAGEHRNGEWITTFSGKRFWPCDPLAAEVHIEDIAHALGLICRFTGHTRVFYSVAQHSVICSQIVPQVDAKWGLMHDASEAYLTDVARPVKPYLANYKALENQLMDEIAIRFGLEGGIPKSVHDADDVLVCTERRDLLTPGPEWGDWTKQVRLLDYKIIPLGPEDSEKLFMERYRELFGG